MCTSSNTLLPEEIIIKINKILLLQPRSKISVYRPSLSDDWVCADNHCLIIHLNPPEFFRAIQSNNRRTPDIQAPESKDIQGNRVTKLFQKGGLQEEFNTWSFRKPVNSFHYTISTKATWKIQGRARVQRESKTF